MATKRSNLTQLITDAVHHGRATASGGKWEAWREDDDDPDSRGYVYVRHYRTIMLAYDIATNEATGLDRGWGSMTDKCGIGQMLRGHGARQSTYREVFDGVTV